MAKNKCNTKEYKYFSSMEIFPTQKKQELIMKILLKVDGCDNVVNQI